MKYSKTISVNSPSGKTEKSRVLTIFAPSDMVAKTVHPGQVFFVDTGLKFNLKKGECLAILPINDNLIKKGLCVTCGLVTEKLGDNELTLEIKNVGANHFYIRAGDSLCGILPIEKINTLEIIDEEDLFPLQDVVDDKEVIMKENERRIKMLVEMGFEETPLSYTLGVVTIPKSKVRDLRKAEFEAFVRSTKKITKKQNANEEKNDEQSENPEPPRKKASKNKKQKS